MPNKIYLDCTHTYNSGLNTGIQRVVKNIVKNIPKVAKETHTDIIPVVSVSNEYYTFDAFGTINKNNNSIKFFLKSAYIKTRTLLDFILPTQLSNLIYSSRIGIFLNKLTDKILFSKKISTDRRVLLEQNDILILVDTTWLNNNYKQLDELKKKNVKIVAVIYDIIPIRHPEFCTIDLTLSLKDWYQKTTKYIDGYIAISNTVKEETYAYIKKNVVPNIQQQNFDYFYLGADFSTDYNEADVPQVFKNLFKSKNTYLTVSTIEPRKNHAYILDTLDTLWNNDEDVTYIMIGREGWKTKSLINRIRTHKQYNKKLFLLTEVDDNALVYAYKHAKALIFASHIEGFGLPIIESLFYQLPVIASDTSIHREIGRDNIVYFDLSDPESLLCILKTAKIKPVEHFVWQNWYQSTKELIQKSKEI